MGKITALTAQKKDSSRVNVFIDGEFALGVTLDLAARLRIGQELTVEELERLRHDERVAQARNRALGLLARRPYSAAEIERNLRKHGYSDEVVTAVREYLTGAELLDDGAFAAYWVEQRESFRPRSRLALRQELQVKGIDRETIAGAVSGVDEGEAARRLATKQARRYSQLPEKDFRAKLSGYLLRQGFGYDIVGDVVRECWLALQTENNE